METLIQLLEFAAPALIGIVSVLVMDLVRSLVGVIDRAVPWVKQFVVVGIAFGLSRLSMLAGVTLPDSLSGLSVTDIEGLAAIGIALAVHAGRKASALSA